MKLEAVLFAAILASVAAAAAEETGAKSPVKGSSPVEEKADPAAEEHKLDFKELFGCEPMGEEGHKPMPKPASGVSQQETMQPAQERGQMREQR